METNNVTHTESVIERILTDHAQQPSAWAPLLCRFINSSPPSIRDSIGLAVTRRLEMRALNPLHRFGQNYPPFDIERHGIARRDYARFRSHALTFFDNHFEDFLFGTTTELGSVFLPNTASVTSISDVCDPAEVSEILHLAPESLRKLGEELHKYARAIQPGDQPNDELAEPSDPLTEKTKPVVSCTVQPYARTIIVPAILFAASAFCKTVRFEFDLCPTATIPNRLVHKTAHITYATYDLEPRFGQSYAFFTVRQKELPLVALKNRALRLRVDDEAIVSTYNCLSFLGYFAGRVNDFVDPRLNRLAKLQNRQELQDRMGELFFDLETDFLGLQFSEIVPTPLLITPTTEAYIWGVESGLIDPIFPSGPSEWHQLEQIPLQSRHSVGNGYDQDKPSRALACVVRYQPQDLDTKAYAIQLSSSLASLHGEVIEDISRRLHGSTLSGDDLWGEEFEKICGALLSVFSVHFPHYSGVLTKLSPAALLNAVRLGPDYLNIRPTWLRRPGAGTAPNAAGT